MTEFLRNVFSRCIKSQRNGDASRPLKYSGDVIYFCVPEDKMDAFFGEGPHKWKLNISSFMWLYKYATNELFEKPGYGYMYEKFVLVVDGEYMRVEGWVPIPKLDLSWCNNGRKRVNNAKICQEKPAEENVVSVDIAKKVTSTEKLSGVKEEDIFTSKASLVPKSQRQRIRFLSYSRHMNPF